MNPVFSLLHIQKSRDTIQIGLCFQEGRIKLECLLKINKCFFVILFLFVQYAQIVVGRGQGCVQFNERTLRRFQTFARLNPPTL